MLAEHLGPFVLFINLEEWAGDGIFSFRLLLCNFATCIALLKITAYVLCKELQWKKKKRNLPAYELSENLVYNAKKIKDIYWEISFAARHFPSGAFPEQDDQQSHLLLSFSLSYLLCLGTSMSYRNQSSNIKLKSDWTSRTCLHFFVHSHSQPVCKCVMGLIKTYCCT